MLDPTPSPSSTPPPSTVQTALYVVIAIIVLFCVVIVVLAVVIVLLYRRKMDKGRFKTAGRPLSPWQLRIVFLVWWTELLSWWCLLGELHALIRYQQARRSHLLP